MKLRVIYSPFPPALAFAFATLHRTHVRIDALYLQLPKILRPFLDILGFLLLGGFLAIVTERAFAVWLNSYESDSVSITPLVTPLAIPQGFWLIGLVFFMIVFTLILLRLIVALFQRDWTPHRASRWPARYRRRSC